ncbi:MAG TPA: cation diffusion facilitator family transporter [Mycobacteriales bacterium]|jgi:cation diffusion facilitator family transporter|nr:cation diffusion facilitator family transporter [Mycobacteriales bacterium]
MPETPPDHHHSHSHEHHHDHDQPGHAHGHDHGILGTVRNVLIGHSHDPADQLDDALEADAAGRRALLISLGGLLLTAVLQAIVVVLSGSVALLGDTLHNLADALTAGPLLIAFSLARRPATRRFTYGYGRTEDLAGLVVLLVMAGSSIAAAWVAVDRLVHPHTVDYLPAVAGAGVVGFLGNEVVARYRITVGRRIGSAALVADGLHARTDGFTSLAVVLGAIGVAAGFPLADPIVGLLITVAILGVLRSAAREVFARLLDAVDPALVAQAEETLITTPGVVAVRALRVRWIGHTLHAEADITVDPALTVTEAHDVAHHAERHLVRQVRRLAAATIHTSPAGAHPAVA